MISDQIKQAEGAARFLTRVLTGFPDSSLFDEYMDAEHFTGEEWDQAIETLTEFGNGPAVTERAVDFDAERAADRQALLVKAQQGLGYRAGADAFDALAAGEHGPAPRADWHEPDEQGIRAIVIGNHLDNAMGDNPMDGDTGEYNVVLFQDGEPVCSRSLATLLAEAAAYRRAVKGGAITPQDVSGPRLHY